MSSSEAQRPTALVRDQPINPFVQEVTTSITATITMKTMASISSLRHMTAITSLASGGQSATHRGILPDPYNERIPAAVCPGSFGPSSKPQASLPDGLRDSVSRTAVSKIVTMPVTSRIKISSDQ